MMSVIRYGGLPSFRTVAISAAVTVFSAASACSSAGRAASSLSSATSVSAWIWDTSASARFFTIRTSAFTCSAARCDSVTEVSTTSAACVATTMSFSFSSSSTRSTSTDSAASISFTSPVCIRPASTAMCSCFSR
uniref:Putative secreted protein n=1 Tax=Anopheles darlingi TaxID=43151 RepID=A0A2M4D0S7_ANODA